MLQVLSFNTVMTHLRHLAGRAVSAGAYCRARMRLPLAVLQQLPRDSSPGMRAALTSGGGAAAGLRRRLRAHLVDGSSTITPDVPRLRKAFGRTNGCKAGCGFPIPKLLGSFDAFTWLVMELLAFPLYTHEQSKAWRLHPLLGPGDLRVRDRGGSLRRPHRGARALARRMEPVGREQPGHDHRHDITPLGRAASAPARRGGAGASPKVLMTNARTAQSVATPRAPNANGTVTAHPFPALSRRA